MTIPELTTAAEVMANARRVQARIAASRPMARPKPIMTKVEAPAPVIVPPPAPKKTKAIKEAVANAYPKVSGLHPITKIVRIVAWFYNVSPVDIVGPRRTLSFIRPRQVAVYLARTTTDYSLLHVGRRMGGRDHATIIHSVRKIAAMRAVDPKLDADLTVLEAKLMPAMKQRNVEVAA